MVVLGGLMQRASGRVGTALVVVIILASSAGSSQAHAQDEPDPSGLCGSWPVPETPDTEPPELSLQWPTPDVVMRTGIESNFWGYVGDDQAVTSIQGALQHIETGLWWRPDQTWGDREMHPAAVVDADGHWRWTHTPQAPGSFSLIIEARDAAGNLTSADTTFAVIGEALVPTGAQPTPQHTPQPGPTPGQTPRPEATPLPTAQPTPTVVPSPTPPPTAQPTPTVVPSPTPPPNDPPASDPDWVLR